MKKYSFLHLSDIHFGQEKHGTRTLYEDVRSQLTNDASLMRANLGPADGILITGDIAFSGKPSEYKEAGKWIDKLIETLGCDKKAVLLIPGNHDVDVKKSSYLSEIIDQKLRNSSPEKIDEILNGINSGDELANPIFAKLSAYREFAARYDCDFKDLGKPFWVRDFEVDAVNKLRFIGLNTVQVSDLSDKVGDMVLGSSQYIIANDHRHECIVLMHHPLNWLKDAARAEKYLKRARMIMVGHEHNLRIHKVEEIEGSERLEIFAGATNPAPGEGYNFRYNWMELDTSYEDEAHKLSVTIHPRIWDEEQTKFVPDLNRLGGNSSKTVQLNCPNFVVSNNKSGEASKEYLNQEDTGMMMEQKDSTVNFEDGFADLRYFFWKYLDWQQRLEVLVELDLLPATRTQPVPQTLEKLALERASKTGKLFDLWNKIMKFIPAAEQEENPFKD